MEQSTFVARYKEDGKSKVVSFSKALYTPESAKEWLKGKGINNFFLFFEPYPPIYLDDNTVILRGDVGFDITADNILEHIQNGRTIILNTGGGDLFEGWRIHDTIKYLGTNPSIGVIGSCMSAGTAILMATENRWMSKNSRTLVHNPWSFEVGDDERMRNTASMLEGEKIQLAEMYASVSGKTVEEMLALMKEEKYLNASQSLAYNFVKEIKADIELNTEIEMTNEELTTKIEEGHKGILDKILALFRKQGVVKSLVLKTADDKNLDFGEDIQEAGDIQVGTPVTVDGAPAEGEYTMPDGTIYVCSGGKVTEIKAPAADPEPEDAVAKENETLKAQLAERDAALKEAQETLAAVQQDLADFKAQITSDIQGFKPTPPTPPDGDVVRKPFKSSK